jgi:hypothetical protein
MGGGKVSERKTAKESTPLNDIAGLARHVPEVDPAGYFDEQARQAYEEALVKWPLLARLMGLGGEGGEAGDRS